MPGSRAPQRGDHDDAIEGGEAHGGIDVVTIADGGEGAAAAEMAGDHLEVLELSPDDGGGALGVLVADAMESIASDSLSQPLEGSGIDAGRIGDLAVEGGVEDGDLAGAGDEDFGVLDAFEVGGVVDGSEGAEFPDGVLEIGSDEGAFAVGGSPVNDAMANDIDLGGGIERAPVSFRWSPACCRGRLRESRRGSSRGVRCVPF